MKYLVAALAVLAVPVSVYPARAEGFVETVGSAERIDIAGKLRMLSQRIPAAACNEAAGIAVDQAAAVLESSVAEYDRIIAALEHGDEGLGILGAEQDRKVLMDIQAIHAVWDPLHVDLDAMIAGEVTMDHAHKIEEASHSLLKIAQHLTAVVTEEYADPTELMQADAMVIDIAGRQRMLAQQVSRDACLIASGDDVEASQAELVRAVETYGVSLVALRNGMPEAGISAPPSQQIADGLSSVAAKWDALQPILAALQAGQTVSDADREAVFLGMNTLTGEMNTIVGLYAGASKLAL